MRVLGFLISISFVLLPVSLAGEWPHLRGPNLDGRVVSDGALSAEKVGLEVEWTAELGPGYSGVAIAAGRAVTMFSDGEFDWIVAFDTTTGEASWRYRIDTTLKGRDGSDGGPLSTPVVSDGTVFGLGPRGRLFALRLTDGKKIWARTLEKDFDASAPHFGFTTTPLVDGKVLVLQTGGPDGKAISGIDTKNGKTLWSLGDGKIEYQSPTLMEIAGGNQVVAIAGKTIQGIDSADGEVLWKHELGEDDRVESANPTRAGRNRILLFASGSAAVIEVARKAGAYETKELYRSKDLGNTYALPVYHDGHLYGFRRQFLTCVDAETGKAVWKSRPPGGRGLILVDDRLVVFGSGGNVVVVEATHEGYRETTRLQALDGSGYTWPSFAEGRIYVRNLEKLASVSIVEATTASTDPASTVAIAHTEFGKFVQRVEEASDKDRLIEEFVKANEHSPVIEGNYVHFFYLGDVEDIAISGSMIASGNPEPMERIEGTELHYRSYKLEPAGRWEYEYNLNFEERVVDPRNSRTVPAQFGERSLSVAMMPGYETADYLAEPEGERRGTMEAFTYKSEMLGNEREIQVYLPYGYQDGDRSFPLLIVHQGEDWLDKGKMANSLDNLIGERVAPVVVAFVPPRGEWWLEAGGSGTDDFVDMLADELVPFLDERYRLIEDASSRALMGTGYFGVTAAYGALRNADVFGNAALQSVALGLGSDDALMEAIGRGRGDEVRFYLDWSRYETRRVDQGVDLGEDNRSLARALEEGGFGFVGGEVLDSYGWGGWPNRTGEILVTFFPAD